MLKLLSKDKDKEKENKEKEKEKTVFYNVHNVAE